ncbi:putative deoxyribonuclease TATDN3 isoform X2 [Littorina saxatilis]|uniref:putative deoxyribonuclease TATDN3 isoform X2 n=1 Tax=Littorina saxatilis TaxID=31220 RepID=UPI0038B597CC
MGNHSDIIMAASVLVDVHTHLTDEEFTQDIDDVISKAKEAGLAAVVAVSESAADFTKVLALADRYPDFVAPCLGLHPVQKVTEGGEGAFGERSVSVKEFEDAEHLLEEHSHRLTAIGEIGLDFTPRWCKTPEDKAAQREVLSRQVKLAQKHDLPINVHSRSAGQPTINLLKDLGASKVLLHAFDGRASVALSGVQCGYYFSVPPSICRSPQKQKLVSAVPLSNVLLETDSPVLGPDRTVRNVPANVNISCEWIAQIKKVSVDEVREITTQNAIKLFPTLAKLVRR